MRLERRHVLDAAIALALATAAWVLYGEVLSLWWTHDDFHHLHYLLSHRPYWYFFDGAAFRDFPARLVTPLLFFSLDVDRRLFGIDPHAFYLHQLLAFSLCTAALYAALRLWLPRWSAATGAGIFLVGPVAASLPLLLFVRHYVEAVLLASLGVLAWGLALRRTAGTGATLRWASAALYFAACMAKEIAVPLALLLPLLPPPREAATRRVAERARLAVPHAVALLVYLVIRFAVLGTLGGGYGFVATASSLPRLALELPGKLAAEMLGGRLAPAAMVFGVALVVGVLCLLVRSRRSAALSGLALLLAVLPVLPVSTVAEPRYAVAAWLVLAVVFACGCHALASSSGLGRRAAAALAIVALLAGLWLNREDWQSRFGRVERMSAENRFLLRMRAGDVLRQPLTLAASLKELAWVRETVYHLPHGGSWFQDDLYLCLHPGRLGRVWGYDAEARRVVNVTRRIPRWRARHCGSIRVDAPLTAHFDFTGSDLVWELGPYREGTYRFVLREGAETFAVPANACFRLGPLDTLPLRVAYEAPEGWVTYSSELDVRRGFSTRWSRP